MPPPVDGGGMSGGASSNKSPRGMGGGAARLVLVKMVTAIVSVLRSVTTCPCLSMPDWGVDTLRFVSTSVIEDFTRVTVISPSRRIDLALPSSIALGEILPNIVRFSGYEPGSVQESVHTWVLQRIGDDPLDPNAKVSALSIRDGEILHLRKRAAAMPDAAFDDVVDAVATATNALPAWTPTHSRRVALAMLAAVTTGIPLVLLMLRAQARGWATFDPIMGGITLGLGLGAGIASIVLSRAFNRHAVAATLGWITVALFGLGGFFMVPEQPQIHVALLVAFTAILIGSATIGLAARVYPYAMLATVLTATLSLIVTMAMVLMPSRTVEVSAIAVAVMLVMMAALPQLSYMIAQIAMPVLPSDAEQLMADDEPIQLDIVSRAVMADRLLASFIAATVVTAVIFCVPILQRGSWPALCLGAAVSLALLLRARAFVGLSQRLVILLGGIVSTVVTVVQVGIHTAGSGLVLGIGAVVIVVAAAALMVYAARGYDRILSPTWGRIGDIIEWIAIMAVIPLVLAVLDVYTFMLGLGG